MTTTPPNASEALAALDATTRALLAANDRRLAEAREIKSPAELGITADRSRNGRRTPGSRRHRAFH
jgi:hypothetical protein